MKRWNPLPWLGVSFALSLVQSHGAAAAGAGAPAKDSATSKEEPVVLSPFDGASRNYGRQAGREFIFSVEIDH